MTTANNTIINWNSDSLKVITAKQELERFLQEQKELKGKCSKIDAYHNRRILELNDVINAK
jgi:hypothetical protein